MRRPGKPASPDTDAGRVAELEQRVADLERAVAALGRFAARNCGTDDIYLLPGNRAVDNRPDAAVILKAARQVVT